VEKGPGADGTLRATRRRPEAPRPEGAPSYRPWAELLARTFAVDVLACPKCHGRMRLLAMVEDPTNVARYLAAVGEATEVPPRSPGRGPPYWKSRVLRRQALGEEDDGLDRWVQDTAWPSGREMRTGLGAAEPAHRAGSRPPGVLP
jgi:uncharacterized protein YbaR (Trm112 family)